MIPLTQRIVEVSQQQVTQTEERETYMAYLSSKAKKKVGGRWCVESGDGRDAGQNCFPVHIAVRRSSPAIFISSGFRQIQRDTKIRLHRVKVVRFLIKVGFA